MQSDLSTTNSRFSAVWGRRQQVCWLWSLQQKLRTNVFISLQVIYVLVCWCSGRTTDVSSSTCSDRFQYVHRMILDAGVGLQHQELVKSRCSLLQLFPVMLRQLQRIRLHSRGFKSQTTEHFQVSSGTITRRMIETFPHSVMRQCRKSACDFSTWHLHTPGSLQFICGAEVTLQKRYISPSDLVFLCFREFPSAFYFIRAAGWSKHGYINLSTTLWIFTFLAKRCFASFILTSKC